MIDFDAFIELISTESIENVRKKFRKEFINERSYGGFTVLHEAAIHNKSEVVEYLLAENSNIEENNDFGNKSIHLSAKFGHVEVLKTLIDAGSSLGCVNKEGKTAIDLAIERKNYECVEILNNAIAAQQITKDIDLLKKNSLSKIMHLETGKTLLDELMINNDPRIIEAIRSKVVDDQELKDWKELKLKGVDHESYKLLQECLLARCIIHKHYEGIDDLCTPHIANKKSLFMGLTTLETAITWGLTTLYVRKILYMLVKEDESWQRAENIAKTKNNEKVIHLIRKRIEYLKNQEKYGSNRLNVAVIEDDGDMIDYILTNKLMNESEGHRKGGSALGLSYLIGHNECAQSFQRNNVNVNSVDWFIQSALHMAIYNRVEDVSDYLVENMIDFELPYFMGFTFLELSVMNDCRDICERLVTRGAKCDKFVKFNPIWLNIETDLSVILFNTPHLLLTDSETIYTLCFKVNKVVYPCLFVTINEDNVDRTDRDGNSLLHLCAVSLEVDLSLKLIEKLASINLENGNKRTPLFELLIQNCNKNEVKEEVLKTAIMLIDNGASLNGKDLNDCDILEIATKYEYEKLLLALIRNRQRLKYIKKTQWVIWINNQYYAFIKEVIPLIEELLLVQFITQENIKCCLKDNEYTLVKTMYNYASPEVQMNAIKVILKEIKIGEDIILFNDIIDYDIPPTLCLDQEEALLNYVIKGKMLFEDENIKMKPQIHIYQDSPLCSIIDHMIENIKSVNYEDDDGETVLSILFTKMSESFDIRLKHKFLKYVKDLIIKSVNIYKINKLKKTVISYCTTPELKEKIEVLFAEHHAQDAHPTLNSSEIYQNLIEETGYTLSLDIDQTNIFGLQSVPSD